MIEENDSEKRVEVVKNVEQDLAKNSNDEKRIALKRLNKGKAVRPGLPGSEMSI